MAPLTEHLNPYARLDPSLLRAEFAGKSVLITGGGHGIGASIATAFAQAGVSEIILAGRTISKLESTVASITSSFKDLKVTSHKVDISNKEDVKNLFGALKASPDVLVNNAGFLSTPANFVDADLDDYWEAFTTNVYGTALVTQSYLKHRRALDTKTTAVVITLNTLAAYTAHAPNLSAYCASKSALLRWSELMNEDVPTSTARFISVHPGAVKTNMGYKSGLDGVFPATSPELAANFVAWTASEEASFLAGRLAWVNWDINELVARKEEVLEKDLLRSALSDLL
jgi:NAD(P)-dependent dehydrogenase (short-subunit alcohol dehydrogenase family)